MATQQQFQQYPQQNGSYQTQQYTQPYGGPQQQQQYTQQQYSQYQTQQPTQQQFQQLQQQPYNQYPSQAPQAMNAPYQPQPQYAPFPQQPQQQQPQLQQQQIIPAQQPTGDISKLAPLPAPGMYCMQQHIAQQTTSVVMREELFSFSGDSQIRDVFGRVLFNVKGSMLTLSHRKEIYDANNNHVFTLRAEMFSTPMSFYCDSPNGERFLSVQGKMSFFKRVSAVSFGNRATGLPVNIELKDNYFNTHAEIALDNGHVVATIDRTSRWGPRTYTLTVAPGMDVALCIAMCIAMDERVKEGKNRARHAAGQPVVPTSGFAAAGLALGVAGALASGGRSGRGGAGRRAGGGVRIRF